MLDPDIPTLEMVLNIGDLTERDVRVARAVIRWANTKQEGLVLCRKVEHIPEHDGATGYVYYEPVTV